MRLVRSITLLLIPILVATLSLGFTSTIASEDELFDWDRERHERLAEPQQQEQQQAQAQVGRCFKKVELGICVPVTAASLVSEFTLRVNRSMCCSAFPAGRWSETCDACTHADRQGCESGFMRNRLGQCQDVDECEFRPCERGSICRNLSPGFACSCPKGQRWHPAKNACIVRNFCRENWNICGPHSICVNKQVGGEAGGAGGGGVGVSERPYECVCLDGYTLNKERTKCYKSQKFDFCRYLSGGGADICANGKCNSLGATYWCTCNLGFAASKDRKSCHAINYCAHYAGEICLNGLCFNKWSSSSSSDYYCVCNPGYTASYNRKSCINNCEIQPDKPCRNGRCIPFGDSFKCECDKGYLPTKNAKRCVIETQRDSRNYCDYYAKHCKPGKCIPAGNSYRCECAPGYRSANDGMACEKDERYGIIENPRNTFCDVYGNVLCRHGKCFVPPRSAKWGDYECRCNPGFRQSLDKTSCKDIDECSENYEVCDYGSCTNVPGSYLCHCYNGFKLLVDSNQRQKCADVNECVENPGSCAENEECRNTIGAHECDCKPGFRKNQFSAYSKCERVRAPLRPEPSGGDAKAAAAATATAKCRWHDQVYVCECGPGKSQLLQTRICADLSKLVDLTLEKRIQREADRQTDYLMKFEMAAEQNVDKFVRSIAVLRPDMLHHLKCRSRYHETASRVNAFSLTVRCRIIVRY